MAEAYGATGFAYVVDHGIPERVIGALFDASRRFHALPQAAKDAIAVNRHHRGYIGAGAATDRASSVEAATRPNLSESFIKLSDAPPGREAWPLDGPNRWPDLEGFREAVEAFEAAAEPVARRLVAAMALGLGAEPGRLLRLFEPPTAWLRLLRYPPRPADAPPDRYGSAPHTDFGCLTLLAQDDAGGLEVRAADGSWIPRRRSRAPCWSTPATSCRSGAAGAGARRRTGSSTRRTGTAIRSRISTIPAPTPSSRRSTARPELHRIPHPSASAITSWPSSTPPTPTGRTGTRRYSPDVDAFAITET